MRPRSNQNTATFGCVCLSCVRVGSSSSRVFARNAVGTAPSTMSQNECDRATVRAFPIV
jgi:hypothetical protein